MRVDLHRACMLLMREVAVTAGAHERGHEVAVEGVRGHGSARPRG